MDNAMGGTAEDRLSDGQSRLLKNRLKGLYAWLKDEPALMVRRLQISSRKPEIPKDKQPHFQKRIFQHSLAVPVCPSRTEWRQLHFARDINDTEVEIFQPEGTEGRQWFYTVRCDSEMENLENQECPLCCRGISSSYASRCITKQSYVVAFVKRRDDTHYDWNWIQVDSSCNCAIFEIVP